MEDKAKKEEVKKMAEQNRASWMDRKGGEGDQKRAKAAEARAGLSAGANRATAREAPRTVSLNVLLGRTPSVDATGAAATPTLPVPPLSPELAKLEAQYNAKKARGELDKGQ